MLLMKALLHPFPFLTCTSADMAASWSSWQISCCASGAWLAKAATPTWHWRTSPTACWRKLAELGGKESCRRICMDRVSSRTLGKMLWSPPGVTGPVEMLCHFLQDRRPEVALLEKISGQTWTHHYAVSLLTGQVRPPAAFHPPAAETLPCQQVCFVLCSSDLKASTDANDENIVVTGDKIYIIFWVDVDN